MATRTTTRRTLTAATLTGDDVMNLQDETVGTVKDIMLDLDSGQIAYVVLSVGGFLGMGDRLFAIPWNAVKVDGARHALVLDVNKERLENAPGFDKDNWPDFADTTWGETVHEYFGTRPYWIKHV